MDDRDEVPPPAPVGAPPPLDRQEQDGAAGAGDMLGGTSTGAGGRLGPDADAAPAMPANQHSFGDAEPVPENARTDQHGEAPA
jgi:hypothetical protein